MNLRARVWVLQPTKLADEPACVQTRLVVLQILQGKRKASRYFGMNLSNV